MSNKAKYPIIDVIAAAVAVDRVQGFVKSGYGYYDHDLEKYHLDNKTMVRTLLSGESFGDQNVHYDVSVTDADREFASELYDFMSSVVVEKKMLGTASGFDESVATILESNEVNTYGISIIASLPNSYRVQQQRDAMEEWYGDLRGKSEFVGEVGKRSGFTVYVRDVKFISKHNIHLVTTVTEDSNIVTFFWNKDPDISDLIVGKTVNIVGTVKVQEVSKFSDCKETILNRVKIK